MTTFTTPNCFFSAVLVCACVALPVTGHAITRQTVTVVGTDVIGGPAVIGSSETTFAADSEVITEDIGVAFDEASRAAFSSIDRFGNLSLGVDLFQEGTVSASVEVFSNEAVNTGTAPARARSFVLVDGGFLRVLGFENSSVSLFLQTTSSALASPAQSASISLTMDNNFGSASLTRVETHPLNLEDPAAPIGFETTIGFILLEIDLGTFDPGERVALAYSAVLTASSTGPAEVISARYTDPVSVVFSAPEFIPVDATVPLPPSGLMLAGLIGLSVLLRRPVA